MKLPVQNYGGNFHTKSYICPRCCVVGDGCLQNTLCEHTAVKFNVQRHLGGCHTLVISTVQQLQDHCSHQSAFLYNSMCLTLQLITFLSLYHNKLSSCATA